MTNNLTQKEMMLLKDQQKNEEICIQKYQAYASQAQDPQLKTLFNSLQTQEEHHLNTINQIMNGQTPSMSSQQGMSAGASGMQSQAGSTSQSNQPGSLAFDQYQSSSPSRSSMSGLQNQAGSSTSPDYQSSSAGKIEGYADQAASSANQQFQSSNAGQTGSYANAEQSAGYTGQQSSSLAGAASSQSDADLCQDMLMTEKYVSGAYDTAIFEFTNNNLRQALNHIQKEEQEHGEQIFNYMQTTNMYNPQ